jgi:hypothetical protein
MAIHAAKKPMTPAKGTTHCSELECGSFETASHKKMESPTIRIQYMSVRSQLGIRVADGWFGAKLILSLRRAPASRGNGQLAPATQPGRMSGERW